MMSCVNNLKQIPKSKLNFRKKKQKKMMSVIGKRFVIIVAISHAGINFEILDEFSKM